MTQYRNTRSGITVQAPRTPNWGGEWTNLDDDHTTSELQPTDLEPTSELQPTDLEPTSEPAADTPTPHTAAPKLPSPRATFKTWFQFMAANNIEHPEDAHKKELQAIAEAHYAKQQDPHGGHPSPAARLATTAA